MTEITQTFLCSADETSHNLQNIFEKKKDDQVSIIFLIFSYLFMKKKISSLFYHLSCPLKNIYSGQGQHEEVASHDGAAARLPQASLV